MLVDPDARVQTGALHSTPAVFKRVDLVDVHDAVQRHMRGDWGNVSKSDANKNEIALLWGGRMTSAYQSKNGVRFWVSTEADRSKTTVLLPRDNRDNNKSMFKFLKPEGEFRKRLFRYGFLLKVFLRAWLQ